jgi:hypothetical protein
MFTHAEVERDLDHDPAELSSVSRAQCRFDTKQVPHIEGEEHDRHDPEICPFRERSTTGSAISCNFLDEIEKRVDNMDHSSLFYSHLSVWAFEWIVIRRIIDVRIRLFQAIP